MPLPVIGSSDGVTGGDKVVDAAFASIHDSIHARYDQSMADDFGRKDSPYAMQRTFVLEVPQGLIRHNEELKLTAQVEDSDGAVGLFERKIKVMADTISPKLLFKRPSLGFGAIEDSDFTLVYQAFDNVKVNRLVLARLLGARAWRSPGPRAALHRGTHHRRHPFRGLRAGHHGRHRHPEYSQLIHVDRLAEIVRAFGLTSDQIERVSVRVRLEGFDAANNAVLTNSYPINIDARPVIDVVEPVPGARSWKATRCTSTPRPSTTSAWSTCTCAPPTATAQPPYEMRLRQSPYNFSVPMPAFDPDNPQANQVQLSLEAVDTTASPMAISTPTAPRST